MTKAELIASIAEDKRTSELSKAAICNVVDVTFETIAKTIKMEERFVVPGFGTFTVKSRKARKGRNPRTGEAIEIKASKTIGFKPTPSVKESL